MQHCALLRVLLPAQRLGEASPRLWTDPPEPPIFCRGGLFWPGWAARASRPARRGGCDQFYPQRGPGRQLERSRLCHHLAFWHAGNPSPAGHHVPLGERQKGTITAAATTALQMGKQKQKQKTAFNANPQLPDTCLTSRATSNSTTESSRILRPGFKWS